MISRCPSRKRFSPNTSESAKSTSHDMVDPFESWFETYNIRRTVRGAESLVLASSWRRHSSSRNGMISTAEVRRAVERAGLAGLDDSLLDYVAESLEGGDADARGALEELLVCLVPERSRNLTSDHVFPPMRTVKRSARQG